MVLIGSGEGATDCQRGTIIVIFPYFPISFSVGLMVMQQQCRVGPMGYYVNLKPRGFSWQLILSIFFIEPTILLAQVPSDQQLDCA